jgi:hypothetical protein
MRTPYIEPAARYVKWRLRFIHNSREHWITVDAPTGLKWDAVKIGQKIAPSFWRYVEARPVHSTRIT